MQEQPRNQEPEKRVERFREKRKNKIRELNDFDKDYDVDKFISDLEKYFENEVDFNLDKIREEVRKQRNLEKFIHQALQKKTHPVVEFVQGLFKGLQNKE